METEATTTTTKGTTKEEEVQAVVTETTGKLGNAPIVGLVDPAPTKDPNATTKPMVTKTMQHMLE